MQKEFENYLQEFKKKHPELAIQLYYIFNILHYYIIIPLLLLFIAFTNNILILMLFILVCVGVIWHWEIYGECCLTTIERELGGDIYKKNFEKFKKIYGAVISWIILYMPPIIGIIFALYRIYYFKTTCKRR